MTAVDLDFERKKRSNDNGDMTPADLLRYALEDLEKGDYPRASKCLILIVEADDDTSARMITHQYRAGMTRCEEIAHLEGWKANRIEQWQK